MSPVPDRVRLPLAVDHAALAGEALALPGDAWVPHFNTGIYDGDWSGVALRAAADGPLALYPDPASTGFVDTEALAACPATAAVLARIPAPLLSARFLRLGAGSTIRTHRDHRLGHADGEVRLHVPVVGSVAAELVLDGRPVPMAPGEVWYLDVNRPHQARNPGPGPRIHLVVDCVVSPGLDVLLGAAPAGRHGES